MVKRFNCNFVTFRNITRILSDSVAWRKPYQDVQDLGIFRICVGILMILSYIFCLNQDLEDLGIFRIFVGIWILSGYISQSGMYSL
jgi:hypothetical protein